MPQFLLPLEVDDANLHQATGQHEHQKTMFLLCALNPQPHRDVVETQLVCAHKGLNLLEVLLLWGQVRGSQDQARFQLPRPQPPRFAVSFVLLHSLLFGLRWWLCSVLLQMVHPTKLHPGRFTFVIGKKGIKWV